MPDTTALAIPDPDDDSRKPVPADVSYEVAIDPEPAAAPAVRVDPLPREGVLLPVIPAHLQTRSGVQLAVRRQAGRHWHRAKYHGLRSPRYLLLATLWAVVGAVVLLARWLRWWLFPVPPSVHLDAMQDGHQKWRTIHREHKETAKTRAWISLAVGLPAAVALSLMWFYAPWWAWALLAVPSWLLLARHGRPADRPIITPAVVTPRFRKLSADIVLRAYYAAALGHPEKPDMQVTFGSTMARDGEGTSVLVDLPYGKTLKQAVDAKDEIASGLDVQTSQVFLHRDPTSTRRHRLWVADRDPLAVPVGKTPLLACKQTDIWKPAPLGLDERGQLVKLLLMWQSVLLGALPRQGKTFVARALALFAALDPYVGLDVFDGKGSPDWRKFALVADSCAFGLTPTKDGLPPEILLDTLRRIKLDVQDRYTRLSELADKHPELCPEGKLTRTLARDKRFGMPVRFLVIDEVQEYYDLGDISKEIAALLVFLVKVAPGAGYGVIASTQKPSGIGGTGAVSQQFISFRDQFQVRFGLRTSSWQVSEMVLGQGAYSEGLDTSTLLPQYRGVGILRGASDASPTVRTYLADGQDAERILTAARGLRERAGTLDGYAAGLEMETSARDALKDALAVFGTDTQLHWELLTARLARMFPEAWGDATPEAVSAQIRGRGVRSADVRYPPGRLGTVKKGCYRAEVQTAAARGTAGQED
jgi:hypothetical protein